MKKLFLLTLMVIALPLSLLAQDDMYFVPSKSAKTKSSAAESRPVDGPVYYRGRNVSVDEYNRRHMRSSYEKIGTDSVGNDIIEFTAGDGVYPENDTIYIDKYLEDDKDFRYSTRMGRFDGFYGWYDPFFRGYWGWGRYPYRYYGWYDPWYDPWYYGWYDPWYYGWYDWYWYSPWYYTSYYYYGPGYYHGGYVYPDATKRPDNTGRGYAVSTGRGYTAANNGYFGGRGLTGGGRSSAMSSGPGSRTTYTNNSSAYRPGFGGNRSTATTRTTSSSRSYTPRSSSSSSYSGPSYSGSSSRGSSYSGGGSFGGGGSRSGGGFSGGGSTGGGSRSGGGGGGGFGGRR